MLSNRQKVSHSHKLTQLKSIERDLPRGIWAGISRVVTIYGWIGLMVQYTHDIFIRVRLKKDAVFLLYIE